MVFIPARCDAPSRARHLMTPSAPPRRVPRRVPRVDAFYSDLRCVAHPDTRRAGRDLELRLENVAEALGADHVITWRAQAIADVNRSAGRDGLTHPRFVCDARRHAQRVVATDVRCGRVQSDEASGESDDRSDRSNFRSCRCDARESFRGRTAEAARLRAAFVRFECRDEWIRAD